MKCPVKKCKHNEPDGFEDCGDHGIVWDGHTCSIFKKHMDKKDKLKQRAKEIANKAGMPYAWEDIMNRLERGIELPFDLKEPKTEGQKLVEFCDRMMGARVEETDRF